VRIPGYENTANIKNNRFDGFCSHYCTLIKPYLVGFRGWRVSIFVTYEPAQNIVTCICLFVNSINSIVLFLDIVAARRNGPAIPPIFAPSAIHLAISTPSFRPPLAMIITSFETCLHYESNLPLESPNRQRSCQSLKLEIRSAVHFNFRPACPTCPATSIPATPQSTSIFAVLFDNPQPTSSQLQVLLIACISFVFSLPILRNLYCHFLEQLPAMNLDAKSVHLRGSFQLPEGTRQYQKP